MLIVLVFDILVIIWKIPLYILNKIQSSTDNSKEIEKDFFKTRRKLRTEKDPIKQEGLELKLKKFNRKIKGYKVLNRFYKIIIPIINHLTLTLTCVCLIIFWLIIPFNQFSNFLLIFQFMILISFGLKWKKLQNYTQLIYFMRLFLQEGKYSKKSDDNPIEAFIKNIQDNHWEEALFNFNLFLKINFEPILEHKSIQRGTMMNNLQRIFNYFVEYKNTGSIRNKTLEDSNIVNTHYNNACFKLFNHLVKVYYSLDDWLKSFISQRYYPLPNYEKFFEVMDKINKFNKNLSKEDSEKMTKINFIESLTEKYENYDISDFGVFEINGSYYFESAIKVYDRMEEFLGDLYLALDLKKSDKLVYYKLKRENKIVRMVRREIDSISNILRDLSARGQLDDFLSRILKEDLWKIESDLKQYKEKSLSDYFFVDSCSRILGKKFIKIIKKEYQKYKKLN